MSSCMVRMWGATLVAAVLPLAVAQAPPTPPPVAPGAPPAEPSPPAPPSVVPPVPVPPARSPVAGRSHSSSQTPAPRVGLDMICGHENWGSIIIELDEERAPATVRNFMAYVDQGYYNNMIFHRIIGDFIAQGGGYLALDQPKKMGLRPPITNEADNQLKNLRYTVAMARGKDPQSATAQFFINLADNPKLDYPGTDGWGYCVFGIVVLGQNVVERVAAAAVQPNPSVPGENSRPVTPPTIRRAYRAYAAETPDAPQRVPQTAKPQRPAPPGSPPPVPPAESQAPPDTGDSTHEP